MQQQPSPIPHPTNPNDSLITVSARRYNELVDTIIRINLMLERQCTEMEKTIRVMQNYNQQHPAQTYTPVQGRK